MIIFLDIDGVLNPCGMNRRSDWPDAEEHIIHTRNGPFSLLLSKQLGQRLDALPATIFWTTTWEQEAYKIGEIIGLDRDYLPLGGGWKRAAVEHTLKNNPGSPFIWIDDDEADYWNESFVTERFKQPSLFIQPKLHLGLQQSDMDDIEEFIQLHKNTRT